MSDPPRGAAGGGHCSIAQPDASTVESGVRNRLDDMLSRAHTSPACTRGAHGECPHRLGFAAEFNPGPLRVGVGVCICDCHASCAVASSDRHAIIVKRTWRESCSCPGAETTRIK